MVVAFWRCVSTPVMPLKVIFFFKENLVSKVERTPKLVAALSVQPPAELTLLLNAVAKIVVVLAKWLLKA